VCVRVCAQGPRRASASVRQAVRRRQSTGQRTTAEVPLRQLLPVLVLCTTIGLFALRTFVIRAQGTWMSCHLMIR